jgi:hypothetical protein
MGYLTSFKMKIKTLILTVVVLFALSSCTEKPDKNTMLFSAYLSKEFNTTIPDSLHYYILIPRMVCKGCSVNTLKDLDSLMVVNDQNYFTFISTNESFTNRELANVKFFKFDTHGRLDNLDLDIANITVVKTKSGKVLFIKPINIDEKKPISQIITFE